jgi:GntR family transcriptional regulator / MocR family aminotransferase
MPWPGGRPSAACDTRRGDLSSGRVCGGVVVVAGSRAGVLDLFLGLDMAGCPTGTRQVVLQGRLREVIEGGRLRAETVVPSTRALAQELGVSRGTVVNAYGELVAAGYLCTRPGGETTVVRRPGAAVPPGVRGVTFPPVDLRAGAADLSSFPWGPWATALRSALARTPGVMLDYPPPAGVEELRSELADYLARSRGVLGSADRIVMCCGLSHAVALLVDALRTAGRARIAMEDPCLPRHRAIVLARGAEVVPVAVDDDGIRLDELLDADPDAVILTPAHQYPMGVALSEDRRRDLVAWAQRHDRLLVEDDYDAEFRYGPPPPGALQPLAPDHVAYAGTLSKTLAPGLRLSWLVLPEWLVPGVTDAKRGAGADNSVLDQLAFAEFVRSRRYDRHLRRMRGVFRRRRDRFLGALDAGVPQLKVSKVPAGLHLVVELPDGGPGESDVLAMVRQAGIGLFGLRHCWHGPPRSQGLIVGFGRPPEHAVDDAVHGLVRVLDRATC